MRGRGIWMLHGMAGERQKRDEDDAVWRRGPRKERKEGRAGRGGARRRWTRIEIDTSTKYVYPDGPESGLGPTKKRGQKLE